MPISNHDHITALHARGVHFVLCLSKDQGARKSKSATEKGWQLRGAALNEGVR